MPLYTDVYNAQHFLHQSMINPQKKSAAYLAKIKCGNSLWNCKNIIGLISAVYFSGKSSLSYVSWLVIFSSLRQSLSNCSQAKFCFAIAIKNFGKLLVVYGSLVYVSSTTLALSTCDNRDSSLPHISCASKDFIKNALLCPQVQPKYFQQATI